VLQTNEILLRAPEPSDIDFLYQLENNTDNWEVSETLLPFSKKLLKEFILQQNDIHTTKQFRWIIHNRIKNCPIGCVDIYNYDPLHRRAGVGVIIIPEFQQNGYANAALNLFEKYAVNTLKLHQLYCFIHKKNTKSNALFKALGYKKNGVKKDWYFNGNGFDDVLFYQKIL
jgi:diamine N-acetyltransferase